VRNKMLLATLLLSAVAFALALNVSSVFAQGPSNTSPGSAVYLDNQTHWIPPNTTLWYKFDYNAERLPVEIILFSGVPQQMRFNVYTPDQIGADLSVGNPIGRGSPPGNSDNLQWKGVFYGAGTYYVELVNPTSITRTFLLGIAGGGVTLRVQPPAPTPLPPFQPPPPPAPLPTINLMQTVMFPAIATLRAPAAPVTPATPVAQPTPQSVVVVVVPATSTLSPTVAPTPQSIVIVVVPATPVPSPAPFVPTPTPAPPAFENNWWTNAYYVVNGRTFTIPGNSGRWFAFDYAGDRSKIEIRLPGGNEKKLQFRLYTTEQVQRYTEDGTPIGVGTAPTVSCDSGKCESNDLVWAGDFPTSGMYFVQVINSDPTLKAYELNVTGSGVTVGR